MKGYRRLCLSIGIIFLTGISACFYILKSMNLGHPDVLKINEIAKFAESHWDNLEELSAEKFSLDFIITGVEGNILYKSKDTDVKNYTEAVLKDFFHINIKKNTKVVGEVFILTSRNEEISKAKKIMIIVTAAAFAFLFAVIILFGFYVRRAIVKPFEDMKEFAGEIAGGNLEVNLGREKDNMFGDFTESFDIMREELKASRKRENELKIKEKELVAELSHDLKTPVTGIKLTAELLEAKSSDEYQKEKLKNIFQKADQIDSMVNDLFAATLNELGEIKVETSNYESMSLSEMVKKCDDKNLCIIGDVPECLISIDLKRMQQIISNIVSNSYKYANTKIEINYRINVGYLEMKIRDFGPGVNSDEIHLVTNKYFRGSSEDVRLNEGSGLGLHIARTLMEKMNGEIFCSNAEPGFEVRLLIVLA